MQPNQFKELSESQAVLINHVKSINDKIKDTLDILKSNTCSTQYKEKNLIYFSEGSSNSRKKKENPEKMRFIDTDEHAIYIPTSDGYLYVETSPDVNHPGFYIGKATKDLETHREVALIEENMDDDCDLSVGDVKVYVFDYVDEGEGIDAAKKKAVIRKKDIEAYLS